MRRRTLIVYLFSALYLIFVLVGLALFGEQLTACSEDACGCDPLDPDCPDSPVPYNCEGDASATGATNSQ